MQGWRDATPNKTWDDHYRTAQRWQDELAGANERIAQEAGTRFVNPGIKKRETAEGKPARKGYSGPQEVTDVVRGAHMLERPDQADAVASQLARHFGPDNVVDEGWKKSFGGYVDRKVMIRFVDGTIGEVQLVESRMLRAKETAKNLYEERRLLAENDPRRDELGRAERQIFESFVNDMPDAWRNTFERARSSD